MLKIKPIRNYEDLYTISENGEVYDIKNNRYLNKSNNGFNYLSVTLTKDRVKKTFKVHRLVADAFIGNPYNKPFVNHIDSDRLNNHYLNLEWCTQKENINHSQKSINGKFNERNKKVVQTTIDGLIVKTYESISEASRQTDIPISSISYCCNGKRKTGGGFLWHFI